MPPMNILVTYPRWLKTRQYYVLIALIGMAITGGALAFPWSYITKSNVLIGFCMIPFVLFLEGKQRFNYFYFSGMVLFAMLAYAYHVRIFYFFTLGFFLIFILEWCSGKVSTLLLFLLGFMSPFFEQVAVITGFPLRLQLSQWAGSLLSLAGLDVQVQGNLMLLNGTGFTVDEACMGLHLLSISMLMGVFVIGHHCRTTKHKLTLLHLSVFFISVFVLNVVSNLFRIMILVAFRILPDDPMHEAIGILCLAVYVMVPLYFLCRWIIVRFGKPIIPQNGKLFSQNFPGVMVIPLAILIVWLGFRINQQRSQPVQTHAKVSLHNFVPVEMKDGITKMSDEQILVYVKPIPEFFTGEHTPLICWKGSGYHFKSVRIIKISGYEIYSGQLAKTGSELNTAWWYTNGKIQTIDQMDWRMRMLKGEADFCLINVTAQDEATLNTKLKLIFEKKLLTIHD